MVPDDELDLLLKRHCYRQVIECWERSYRSPENHNENWYAAAISYACIGNLDKAISALTISQYLTARDLPKAEHFNSDLISIFLYLEDKKKEAIAMCKQKIEGLRNKTISYADSAGGVVPGHLLFYFSSKVDCKEDAEFAVKWLIGRRKHRMFGNWPGAISEFILGRINIDEVLIRGAGCAEVNTLLGRAEHELPVRDVLICGLFYWGLALKRQRDELQFQEIMAQISRLENPHYLPEWYLARREAGMDFWWRPTTVQQ